MAAVLDASREGSVRASAADPCTPHHTLGALREAFLFLYAPFTVAVLLSFSRTPDDAFITLRYARNVLLGNGAVFDLGQHVQGFSSPLHLLVSLPVATIAHGHALLPAKLLSILFAYFAIHVGGRLVRDCGFPTWGTRTALLLLGTSFDLATSASNALETSLYVWLVALLLGRLLAARATRQWRSTACIAFLVAVTRPDSALLVGALVVAGVLIERSQPLVVRVRWCIGAIVGGVALGVVGIVYYGDPLPNTYYAKNGPVGEAVSEGLRYLAISLHPDARFERLLPGIAELLVLFQLALFVTGCVVAFRRDRRLGYATVAVIAQALFAVKSGGDWMVGGRFLAPAVIPLVLLEVTGAAAWIAAVRRHRPDLVRAVAVTGAVVLAIAALAPWTVEASPFWRSHLRFDDQSLIAAGDYTHYSAAWAALPGVVDCVPQHGLVATSEVGNLGYARTDLDLLDLRGLTDEAIAKASPTKDKGRSGVAVPDWRSPDSVAGRRILQVRPDLVVVLEEEGRTPPTALGGVYVRRGSIPISYTHLVVYARADRPGTCANVAQAAESN